MKINNTAPTQKCAPPSLRERGGDAGGAQGQGGAAFLLLWRKAPNIRIPLTSLKFRPVAGPRLRHSSTPENSYCPTVQQYILRFILGTRKKASAVASSGYWLGPTLGPPLLVIRPSACYLFATARARAGATCTARVRDAGGFDTALRGVNLYPNARGPADHELFGRPPA